MKKFITMLVIMTLSTLFCSCKDIQPDIMVPVTTEVATGTTIAIATKVTEVTTTTETSTTTSTSSTTTTTTTTAAKQNVVVEQKAVVKNVVKNVEPTVTESIREYYVYKPSTHYIHKSTCKWNSADCYEITNTEGIEAQACSECNPELEILNKYVPPIVETTPQPIPQTGALIKTFSRGTYYCYGSKGGSGRSLQSGYSIASRYLYETYGYNNSNGNPNKFRIECDDFPELNGVYQLDDCSAAGNNNVVDFYFTQGSVPSGFARQGVTSVRVYIVE